MPDAPQLEAQLRVSTAGLSVARAVHVFDSVPSTNALAMAAGAADDVDGSVFLARSQTAGRGRGGHTWDSEADAGVYLSMLLRPQIRPGDALVLSLLTGLAVVAALEDAVAVHADLRWPNDILIGEHKLGGILTELSNDGDRVAFVVVGIGLNVNQAAMPDGFATPSTSLRIETGKEWPVLEIAAALLHAFDGEYRQLLANPPAALQSAISRFEKQSSYARGKRVLVDEQGGYEGTTDGLDARGFLRVRTGSGIRTVLSGGVRPA